MNSTNKDMADSLSFWGVPKIYKIGFGIHATSWSMVSDKMLAKIRKKTDSIAAKLKSDSFEPRSALKAECISLFFTLQTKRAGILLQCILEGKGLDGK